MADVREALLSLQQEHLETRMSICEDGTPRYKCFTPNQRQYKFSNNAEVQPMVLGLPWGFSYLEDAPNVLFNAIHNRHELQSVKNKICECPPEEPTILKHLYGLLTH